MRRATTARKSRYPGARNSQKSSFTSHEASNPGFRFFCLSSIAVRVSAGRSRMLSSTATRWTHETVQNGAHGLGRLASCTRSAAA